MNIDHDRETRQSETEWPVGTILESSLVIYTFKVVGHDGLLVTLRRSIDGAEQKLLSEQIKYYVDNRRMLVRS